MSARKTCMVCGELAQYQSYDSVRCMFSGGSSLETIYACCAHLSSLARPRPFEHVLAAATPQPPLLRWQPETLVPLPFDAWVGCSCWESAEVEP